MYIMFNTMFQMSTKAEENPWSDTLDAILEGLPTFDSEPELGLRITNQTEYAGKVLSTDARVPGHLGQSSDYHDFYKDVLKASPMVCNWV